jgi:hypothetical protein
MENNEPDLRWNTIYQAAQEEKIKTLFRLFREHGIEPILIKGWSVSLYFPAHISRLAMDIDLTFDRKSYPAALQISNRTKINVDLHNELRHLETVAYSDLYDRSQSVKLKNGTEIRILCPEDGLRIICVHWLNDGGIKKDRLWDIYYCVKNRPPDFDWEKCLNVISPKRRKWILTAIALAHHYLHLPIDDLPFTDEISETNFIPHWVHRTLENEWKSEITLTPLISVWRYPTKLLQQIKKRLPPNPIQAVVETESALKNSSPIFIQIKDIFARMLPRKGNEASISTLFFSKFKKQTASKE